MPYSAANPNHENTPTSHNPSLASSSAVGNASTSTSDANTNAAAQPSQQSQGDASQSQAPSDDPFKTPQSEADFDMLLRQEGGASLFPVATDSNTAYVTTSYSDFGCTTSDGAA